MELPSTSELTARKGRKSIDWRLVGTYSSKDEMVAARKTEKVSKRKSDALKTGLKVTYRCNSWKRTRCAYQMYALHGMDGNVQLYEGGEHDHTNNCSAYVANLEGLKERRKQFRFKKQEGKTTEEREAASALHDLANQVTAQDEFLTNLIQQATSMTNSPGELRDGFSSQENESALSLSDTLFLNKLNEGAVKEEDGSSSSASGLVSNPSDFSLSDGTSISTLLQIAADNDLAFSFNSRRCAEYCFSSNQKAGRVVVFSDSGSEIRVVQKLHDEEICVEQWRKSDWAQFCWAVRGACLHYLK